jgi:Leucine-rich repeat (LRR) protein
LFETPVTAAGLPKLANLKQLQMLVFRSCPIKDAELASLNSVDTLQSLFILERGFTARPNRITDRGFQGIGQMKTLRNLGLDSLKISDKAARELTGLTQLKSLRLIDCQISNDAISGLRQALPNCEVVASNGDTPAP